MKTRYRIRATINKDLVNKIKTIADINLNENDFGEVSACWEVSNDEFHNLLKQLMSFGIDNFLLEESAIHFHIAVPETINEEFHKKLTPYVVDKINVHSDLFTKGVVFSFIVDSSKFEKIHDIIKRSKIKRFLGVECFKILKEVPRCTKNTSSQLH